MAATEISNATKVVVDATLVVQAATTAYQEAERVLLVTTKELNEAIAALGEVLPKYPTE